MTFTDYQSSIVSAIPHFATAQCETNVRLSAKAFQEILSMVSLLMFQLLSVRKHG